MPRCVRSSWPSVTVSVKVRGWPRPRLLQVTFVLYLCGRNLWHRERRAKGLSVPGAPVAALVLRGISFTQIQGAACWGPGTQFASDKASAGLGGDLSWIRGRLPDEPPTHTQRRQESCEAGRRQGPWLITVALREELRCVGVCATDAPSGTSQALFLLLTPFLLSSHATQTPSNTDGQLQ